MGNSMTNIRLRRWSHVLTVYSANVGSVAGITVANIWATKSFLGG